MRATLLACLFCLCLPPRAAQAAEEVDVELLLAVDVSQSMSYDELEIQRQGYAAALLSPSVMDAIRSGMIGAIAVSYVEWAGAGSHKVIVPWTRVATLADMSPIAEAITGNFENPRRRTSISSILLTGANMIDANDFIGLRRVIDVSGDGPNNMGPPVLAARDRVLAAGITINGLPLMTPELEPDIWGIPDLDRYFDHCVIGGPGAFVLPVRRWEGFAPAIRRKLVLEIAGAAPRRAPGPSPNPAATALPIPAQSPAAPYDCLVGEKIWHRIMGG